MSAHTMPRFDARTDLPRWLSVTAVTWVGAIVALLALALGGGFVWYEREKIEVREVQSAELYARVLQEHADRSFATIDLALAALDDTAVAVAHDRDAARHQAELTRAQQGVPLLRSVSVMDAKGVVLASSVPGNVGAVVDPARIPLPLANLTDRLGALVPGRDLADAARAGAVGAAQQGFIPLVRSVPAGSGSPVFTVAALNPDFFAGAYELLLADPSRAGALFSLDGAMLAATESIRLAPGDSAAQHRFFRQFLPARESGSFIGGGIDGTQVVTAFRLLRNRPLAVIVERRYDSVTGELATVAGWVAGACGLALSSMGVLIVLARRSLHGHQAVRRALDATRDHVADSERELRTLVQSVHEWIFRADQQGRITFVNERWPQISGRPASQAMGRRLAELCIVSDRPGLEAMFEPGHAGAAVTARIARASGDVRTLEISVAAVTDANGGVVGFAGFGVDVSERQLAREKLESQLSFTARLLDVSPTPLFVKDAQGRFVTVNRAWLELMGFALDQVVGRDSTDLFGAEASLHHDHDHRLLRSDVPVSYENRLKRPQREERDTVVTKVRFDQPDGLPGGMVGSIIDVTEFREAERRTREARDLAERANSAKSEFIANISHELRTPLQGIIGFSEMGAELASGQGPFDELFSDIQAGGQRMLTLVNGLLDVAQLDGEMGSLERRRTDVALLSRDVLAQLRPNLAARGQQLGLQGLSAPLMAEVEPARFQQAMRNVLANAIRFAPVGSQIDVAAVDAGTAGIELVIRDRGPGIPEAEVEAIFDAFVQSSRTRDGAGGTGLGLTISRKILRAHGGSISASNAPGGGALIRVRLPASVAATVPAGGALCVEPEVI